MVSALASRPHILAPGVGRSTRHRSFVLMTSTCLLYHDLISNEYSNKRPTLVTAYSYSNYSLSINEQLALNLFQ